MTWNEIWGQIMLCFSSIRIRSFQTDDPPKKLVCFVSETLQTSSSQKQTHIRQATEIRISFFQAIHSKRWVIQTERLCAPRWELSSCGLYWFLINRSAVLLRFKMLHRRRRWRFSAQLSESQWGESSLRSCCNYVALECYRGNRQLAASTLARMCLYQWCVW